MEKNTLLIKSYLEGLGEIASMSLDRYAEQLKSNPLKGVDYKDKMILGYYYGLSLYCQILTAKELPIRGNTSRGDFQKLYKTLKAETTVDARVMDLIAYMKPYALTGSAKNQSLYNTDHSIKGAIDLVKKCILAMGYSSTEWIQVYTMSYEKIQSLYKNRNVNAIEVSYKVATVRGERVLIPLNDF